MQTLNLAHLEKSDIKYTIITFPDGEPHITIDSPIGKEEILVKTRICNPTDLMILLEVADILNRYEVYWTLRISYLMSARMDRVMALNRPFTLKVIANILKSLGCDIDFYFLHSDKILDLLEETTKVTDVGEYCLTYNGHFNRGNDIIVFPDKGARDRYIDVSNSISFNKVRNVDTGEILSFELVKEIPKNINKNFIFIDDLCDGGGTFLGELAILKEKYPNRRYSIYITHCVNKIGLQRLLEAFDKVYTTNSYKDWDLVFPEEVASGKLVVNKVI